MISEINLKKSKYAKTLLLCFVFCFFVFGGILLLLVGCSSRTYKIAVGEYIGGEIFVSKTEAKPGQKITITCMPNDGYALKEGSLVANGNIVQEFVFVMPEEDVTIGAKFLPLNFYGSYIASSNQSNSNTTVQDFSFIQVQEDNKIIIGNELKNHSYSIQQNLTYTFDNFELKLSDEEDKIFVEDGQLIFKNKVYYFSPEMDDKFLNSTLIQVSGLSENNPNEKFDLNNSVYTVEKDITFTNDSIVSTKILSNNEKIQSSCNYQIFGHLIYIEIDNDIYYGMFNTSNSIISFNYNHFMSNNGRYSYVEELFIVKSDNEIELKQNGSYIGKNDYKIEDKENEIVSYNGNNLNVALTSITLNTSEPGVSKIEYYQIDNLPMKRVGNILIISLTDKFEDVVFLYIVNENLMLKLGAFSGSASAIYLTYNN